MGLMEIPDFDRMKEEGEALAKGLITLGGELEEAAYAAAYTDLGGED